MNKQQLKELIKELIDEMTSSGGVAGYNTPNAFSKRKWDVDDNVEKKNTVSEARSKYREYKLDDTMKPHQKVSKAVSEINKTLTEVEKIIDMNLRLKSEMDVSSDSYWKHSKNALTKIDEKITRINKKMKDLSQ